MSTKLGEVHNSVDGILSGFSLHAQSLLTAFLQSKQTADVGKALNDVTFKLTDLLKMIFDKNLYSFDTDDGEENFLERLVKHEAGVGTALPADAMVTRFTADLWKLAQEGGLTMNDGHIDTSLKNVSKALTALAMQMYYVNSPTPGAISIFPNPCSLLRRDSRSKSACGYCIRASRRISTMRSDCVHPTRCGKSSIEWIS